MHLAGERQGVLARGSEAHGLAEAALVALQSTVARDGAAKGGGIASHADGRPNGPGQALDMYRSKKQK